MKSPTSVSFGACQFDAASGILRRDDREVLLPPRVAAVLTVLLDHPGEVVSKRTLMDEVWKDACVTDGSLLEAISALREALGDDAQRPMYIQTAHRRGYRFIAPVEARLKPGTTTPVTAVGRVLVVPGFSRAAVLVAALVSMTAVTLFLGPPPSSPSRPVSRFVVPLPQHASLDPLHPSVAISPDGTLLAYAALANGTSRLFVRPMDRIEPSSVAGTEGGTDPFFSPDGRWLGFFAHGQLKKIRLDGGRPIVLCDARNDFGASWGADGTIVFGSRLAGGLLAVGEDGGPPRAVTDVDATEGELRHAWPQILPNGRDVIFTAHGRDRTRLVIASLTSGHGQTLMENVGFARYSPTGHLVVSREDRLDAVPFDVETRAITGTARTLLSGVGASDITGAAQFAFSTNGSLVYVPRVLEEPPVGTRASRAPHPLRLRFSSFDEPGWSAAQLTMLLPSRFNQFPSSWAPDGQIITFTELNQETGADIWLLSLPDRRARPFLKTRFDETTARFSPNGRWIAYSSNETAEWSVYVQSFPGPEHRYRIEVPAAHSPYWSADGRRLFFSSPEGLMWVPVDARTRMTFGPPALASPFASSRELQIVLEWDKLLR